MTKPNPHWGSSLDDLLNEDGIREQVHATAATRVVAWQLAEEMRRLGLTKVQMAERMGTSRAQLDRILKAEGNVTVETLRRAAALVGKTLKLELV